MNVTEGPDRNETIIRIHMSRSNVRTDVSTVAL
jgi:hypothetical protein